MARARSSTPRRSTAIAYSRGARRRWPQPPPAAQARALRPARLRQAPGRPGRPRARGPSPAARRSARGSATSSAASASRSSRATASPRPRRRAPSTGPEALKIGTRRGRRSPARRCGSPTTARCCSRVRIVFARLLEQRRRHRRGDRARTAGSTPATSASSTTTASSAITGRKKEIIVTAGGKNVAPAVLEDRLRAHCARQPVHRRRRQQAVHRCPGHARPRGAAGVADRQGQGRRTPVADLVRRRGRSCAEIQHAVDDANKAVSKAEAIKKFVILPVDFTEEGGELTPYDEAQAQRRPRRTSTTDVEALYA